METKIKYEVEWASEFLLQMTDMAIKMDMLLEGSYYSMTDEYIITTTSKVDLAYLKKLRKTLPKAIEHAGGKCYSVKFKGVESEGIQVSGKEEKCAEQLRTLHKMEQ